MDKQTEERIERAFNNKDYEWRTVRGVAKEAKVSFGDVQEYISNHGDKVVKSSARNSDGEPLYASRKTRRERGSISSRFLSAVRNRGA
ncbi:hypothetical protein M2G63_16400 [Vibrio vulnificus]|uniref:hypothetical protein n=1 Tax=Vibrio harveyi group TaxID=717610 RepID=UPI00084AF328|nr:MULTISPECIES: hypothetical protein [Vibrio harveyi group]MCU8394066.1 hypothetical protein [Vibrio vulnificus]EGQ8010172.1 hypothetical protein [Vibrio parahaemolyticus]EHH2420846.1 hypothetical protein [Vibrio parahaemolyticus]EHK2869966.1 hypothetical protein [Vibrio parahaemolyticus]EHZ2491081.1 hypothetical protein [Vibrio parahaemolyticus]